jgi:hypothetical protein
MSYSPKLSKREGSYWQAGLRVGGFLARRSNLVRLYQFDRPSARLRYFFFDGTEVPAAPMGEFVDYGPRMPHLGLVGLSMDRQFDHGLRVGLEMTFASVRQSLFLKLDELVEDQMDRNDVIVYRESWTEDYSLNLQLGYTFRLHRRLQYYAGIAALNRFSRSGSAREIAIRISDGARASEGRGSVFERSFTRDIRFLPILGVHYQLSGTYRVGMELTTEDLSARIGYRF